MAGCTATAWTALGSQDRGILGARNQEEETFLDGSTPSFLPVGAELVWFIRQTGEDRRRSKVGL